MGHDNFPCSLLLKHNELLTESLALAPGAPGSPKLEFPIRITRAHWGARGSQFPVSAWGHQERGIPQPWNRGVTDGLGWEGH